MEMENGFLNGVLFVSQRGKRCFKARDEQGNDLYTKEIITGRVTGQQIVNGQ
jgi:hypothetical protein